MDTEFTQGTITLVCDVKYKKLDNGEVRIDSNNVRIRTVSMFDEFNKCIKKTNNPNFFEKFFK